LSTSLYPSLERTGTMRRRKKDETRTDRTSKTERSKGDKSKESKTKENTHIP
jgi:hypothetical protein